MSVPLKPREFSIALLGLILQRYLSLLLQNLFKN